MKYPGQAPSVCSIRAVNSVAECQRRAQFGDARGLQISLAAHDRCQAGSVIAARIRVIRQPGRHQQRAQVGVAQAKRAVVVRVAGNRFGRVPE